MKSRNAQFGSLAAGMDIDQSQTVEAQSVDVRAKFISVVYSLLTISIVVAIGGAWLSAATDLKIWVAQNWIIMLILYIATVVGTIFLRHKKPINMIMLNSFTFITGLFIGPVAAFYPGPTISAGVTTAVIFFALSAYARTTKRDLSFMGGFLMMGLIAVLVMMLLNVFFFQSSALQIGISVAGVLVFSGFIMYDTQNIMRRYPPGEYISATLALYLDILNLFWFLLQLFLAFGSNE